MGGNEMGEGDLRNKGVPCCILTSTESSIFHQHLVSSVYFLIALAKTLSTLFHRSGETGRPCLIHFDLFY